jgi:hypothetical protein
MNNGLYVVKTKYFCAGFYIENNKLRFCAPILRKRFNYWKNKGVKIDIVEMI